MSSYLNEREHFERLENNPNEHPAECSPKQYDETVGIHVAIYDRSHPQGLMLSTEKSKALKQALLEMMYRDLMSEADVSPKFNGSEMIGGIYRFLAADEHSAEYLVDIVDRMLPPWPNAELYVDYRNKKNVVEAFVPGERVSTEEILDKITQFDHRIQANRWQTMGCRPLGEGYVFTFTIDQFDFEYLNTYDGFIPYNSTRIEFRVLKDPELIRKVM